ncbi:MAG: alanine racemase [Clostridia bacterium]|nr:alanine racemase [Clostridia bacterium]
MNLNYFKRIWAEVDLDRIAQNVKNLKAHLTPGTQMMAVVKADAYGHGVERVSKTLEETGVDFFAVSSLSEAIQLRRFGRTLPILILGYTPPECAKELFDHNLTQTVYSTDYATALSAAAVSAGYTLDCHIKLDVGMGRLGFAASKQDSIQKVAAVCALPGLSFTGIYTHFPSADLDGDQTGEITLGQIDLFNSFVDALTDKGIHFEIRHCCNSAGSIAFPGGHLDMVREGIALYGLCPSEDLKGKVALSPAMTLKTVVSMVKTLHKGDTVSYGRTVTLQEDRRVATVCIGYADGYPRALSSKGYMMVNGKKAPVIGRVCMDQLLLDVTDIDHVTMGTEVTVFGREGDSLLPVEEVAALCNTIHYELICVLGKRVPRVYLQKGKPVDVTDYIAE